jgi:pimeloyl-ACP methyl ester carboxylesterase
MSLTSRVEDWRRRGEHVEFRGHRLHLFRRDGQGPALLLLHGFPSNSFDWRGLLDRLPDRAALAFDCLGFGLSEKPRDHRYSLFWQADATEELVRRHAGGGPVFVVAHDMGTSVATELMAREIDGALDVELAGALLFNGSILLHRASPTRAQKLLRSPLGPLASRLMSERYFRRGFGQLFSPGHPLSDEEAADQWALIAHDGGHRIAHLTINYMNERATFTDRWHGAIRDWPKPLSFAWGLLDPVATTNVLDGLLELRPAAPVTRLEDLGHYPQVEAPERIAAAIEDALARIPSRFSVHGKGGPKEGSERSESGGTTG